MPSMVEMDVVSATSEAVTLVKTMVLCLVDDPDKVAVNAEVYADRPEETTIHVNSSPFDTGKLVGKQGRTVRSMRTILSGHSARVRHRFALNIIETDRTANNANRS